MTKRKTNNSHFVLTVCLMVTLILLTIPTAMAWFTDKAIGNSSLPIQFGTVNVEIDEEATIFSASRDINNIVPGDTINFTSKLSNENGTVAAYAGVGTYIKIIYTKESFEPQDITQLFQPYLRITPLAINSANVISGTDGITLLEVGETVNLAGSIYFDTSLPNVIGEVEEYILNGHKDINATISLELHIAVGAIQKDNLPNVETAETEIKNLLLGSSININNAQVSQISSTAYSYLKSYIDTYHAGASILATADVESPNNTITVDVSDLSVEPNEEITLLHFDESTNLWETVGNFEVSEENTITSTLSSFSPIALLKPYVKYTIDPTTKELYVDGKNANAIRLNAGTSYENNAIQVYTYYDEGVHTAYFSGQGSTEGITGLLENYTGEITEQLVFGEGITSIHQIPAFTITDFPSIILSSTVETLEESAFDTLFVEKITYHPLGNLKTIKSRAFSWHYMRQIDIPSSVETIGASAFDTGGPIVERISIQIGHKKYIVRGGCLIDKTTKSILIVDGTFNFPTDENIANTIVGGCFTSLSGEFGYVIVPKNITTFISNSIDYWPDRLLYEGTTMPTIIGSTSIDSLYYYSNTYNENGWYYYNNTPYLWTDSSIITLGINTNSNINSIKIQFTKNGSAENNLLLPLSDYYNEQTGNFSIPCIAEYLDVYNGFYLKVNNVTTNNILFSELTNNQAYLIEAEGTLTLVKELPPKTTVFVVHVTDNTPTYEIFIFLTKNGTSLGGEHSFSFYNCAEQSGNTFTVTITTNVEYDGFCIRGTSWDSAFGVIFNSRNVLLSELTNNTVYINYNGTANLELSLTPFN